MQLCNANTNITTDAQKTLDAGPLLTALSLRPRGALNRRGRRGAHQRQSLYGLKITPSGQHWRAAQVQGCQGAKNFWVLLELPVWLQI